MFLAHINIDMVIHPETGRHLLCACLTGLVNRKWMPLNQIFIRNRVQTLAKETLVCKDGVTKFADTTVYNSSHCQRPQDIFSRAMESEGLGSSGGAQGRGDTQFQDSCLSAAEETRLGLSGALVRE